MTRDYGRHLSFPFRIGSDGRTAQVGSLEEHVRDELIQLLLTDLGERAFVPEFGGGVRRLVFEPLNDALDGMAKAQITQAITTWLGERVSLEQLTVTREEATIDVSLSYRVAGSDESRVMRFQRSEEA